ncbi:ead/Ea22-like family protein [Pseudomonas syringae]|uniref:hypothetical protein n=1 Tax=Pseudomonas syringae TaxID=317 RepID=UPI001CA94E84|nr:hypothetical protein [Pseudomonas syringae]MCI3945524.1 ead/Ea22-like family protein [Pseudomonas syringae]
MIVDIEKLEALAKAATQGDWQVIETELPCRLGRPHVERRIFTTKDHPQLKAPYPVVNGSVALGNEETPVHHMVSMTAEDAAYVAAANATAVLELTQTIRDLQSSVQGLKTGYEAYERVNAELRAECEALRKDASLHANLQRAAGELPGAWSIDVSVERHAGWVSLLDGDGCEYELSGEGHLGEQVSEALEVALEMSQEAAQ